MAAGDTLPPVGGDPGSEELHKVVLGRGDRLGDYEIVDLLGTGGMGRVYLARDTRLKRRIALKVLADDLTSDPTLLQRWQREAEAVAALNHPNIVTLYSIEEFEGHRFFTMELVEGRELDSMIPERGMTLKRFFEISVPLADALAAAHQNGIAHRDLKPGNIMVSKGGWVKVLDFGLAKLVDETDSETELATLTSHGLIVGTLPYMSPEQVQGMPVDLRTDIFSLGVVLYEMATGRRPFSSKSAAGLATEIVGKQPRHISELRAELPRHLERVIENCLEKEPERRYQSALDVRNQLEALRREIETGVHSGSVHRAEPPKDVQERIGRYSLRTVWALLLPVAALSGLLGKLVISGMEREVGTRVIDGGGLAQSLLFWAGTFLEQSLDSVLATGAADWTNLLGLLAVLANLLLLVVGPLRQSQDQEAWAPLYGKLYYLATPVVSALAFKVFLSDSSRLWLLAAFVPLLAAYLYYLIRHPDDLLRGSAAQRVTYVVISFLTVAVTLLLPFRYGRDFFDLNQPPVVERAQRFGSTDFESFERSGEITVVVDASANILATIELGNEGKLMSLARVASFEPRAQSKSLRELLTSIEEFEQHDARAIAGKWLEE